MKGQKSVLAQVAPWLYLALLAIGIPWYWPAGDVRLLAGFPLWVITAFLTALAGAVLTAVLLRQPWDDEDGEP